MMFTHYTGELLEFPVIQFREQGDFVEKIDIGQHIFTSHP
jgi:hypothetical protein